MDKNVDISDILIDDVPNNRSLIIDNNQNYCTCTKADGPNKVPPMRASYTDDIPLDLTMKKSYASLSTPTMFNEDSSDAGFHEASPMEMDGMSPIELAASLTFDDVQTYLMSDFMATQETNCYLSTAAATISQQSKKESDSAAILMTNDSSAICDDHSIEVCGFSLLFY